MVKEIKNKNTKFNKKHFRISVIIIVALALLTGVFFYNKNVRDQYYRPEYEKLNITSILKQEYRSEDDYNILLKQTGLGKDVIDTLLAKPDGIDNITKYQDEFFGVREVFRDRLNAITNEDKYISNSSGYKNPLPLENIKNGYILITTSTFTAGFRHGHAGLVIDAERGIVLESLEPGTVSKEQNLSEWRNYPNVIVLRLKNVSDDKHNRIAEYAVDSLMGLDYNLFIGKAKALEKSKTYCSLLIWQAFYNYGYNLDDDGIWVTPAEIANSELLEVVYASGVDPVNRFR